MKPAIAYEKVTRIREMINLGRADWTEIATWGEILTRNIIIKEKIIVISMKKK